MSTTTNDLRRQRLNTLAERYARVLQPLYTRQGIFGRCVLPAGIGARHLSLRVRLAHPRRQKHRPDRVVKGALALAEPMAVNCRLPSVIASTTADGYIVYQCQLKEDYWETYTRRDVTGLGVGLAEERAQIDFSLHPAPHSLFAGSSRTGKTEGAKSAVMALIGAYTPDDVGFYIADPHREFEQFENEEHLVAPIAHTADEIKRLFLLVNQEAIRRLENDIREERRLVIVIDEPDSPACLGNRDSGFTPNLAVAQSVANEMAKFRMHLLITTRKPTQADLPKILNNLANRYVLHLPGRAMAGQLRAGLRADLLTPGGDTLKIGDGELPVRFQIALAVESDYRRLTRRELPVPAVNIEQPQVNFPATPAQGRRQDCLEAEIVGLFYGYILHCLRTGTRPLAPATLGKRLEPMLSASKAGRHWDAARLVYRTARRGRWW